MLVLSRKSGEEIRIGQDIRITVIEVRGNRVRLGFTLPDDVTVMRSEICQGQDTRQIRESLCSR
jgi:carbon storage regulator